MLDVDLDRRGVVIFELDSCDFFPTAYELFGPDGFDLPLSGLVDRDACEAWATVLSCDEGDLAGRGIFVCRADLEAEYVRILGRELVIGALLASPQITEAALLRGCGATSLNEITEDMLADYCRHRKRKVRAALAISTALAADTAERITPVVELVRSAGSA
jgi:putative ATP-dependent endonuclease of OLD family